MRLLRTELGEEVHLQCGGQFRRRSEGYVDVLVKHLRDVRTRHLHALSKLRLRHAELLHPEQNAAEERGTDFIYCGQWNMENGKLKVVSFNAETQGRVTAP